MWTLCESLHKIYMLTEYLMNKYCSIFWVWLCLFYLYYAYFIFKKYIYGWNDMVSGICFKTIWNKGEVDGTGLGIGWRWSRWADGSMRIHILFAYFWVCLTFTIIKSKHTHTNTPSHSSYYWFLVVCMQAIFTQCLQKCKVTTFLEGNLARPIIKHT